MRSTLSQEKAHERRRLVRKRPELSLRGRIVSGKRSKREAHSLKRAARPPADQSPESRARKKIRALWRRDDLFHMSWRYPRKHNFPPLDRLAGILERGLIAPARCPRGLVRSDLKIVVTGTPVPYDSLVFLHRFTDCSYIYTVCEPGRFAVFVDPALPVLTPEDMEPNWPLLCQDEVYVRDSIGLDKLTGIAVYPEDAEGILAELRDAFRRAEIPLYDYDGNVLWPPG
jgi:hypothetical protein